MKATTIILFLALLTGCGDNVFEGQEQSDPAEDATIALENQDPDAAIEILEDALEDDPDNAQYTSILSLAYAQRAGVEPLSFALELTTGEEEDEDSGDSGGSTQYELMFAILPDPDDQALTDIAQAVSLLSSLSSDDLLPGDTFKLAMFQTAYFVMQTKRLDTDLDGSLAGTEVDDLTAEDAAALLNQIDQVSALLAESGEDDATSAAAAESIAEFQAELDAQPGDTDEEKLENYLASQGE